MTPPQSTPPMMHARDIPFPCPKFGAQGIYDLTMATLALNDEILAPVLPPGLELMPSPGCPPGRHVVVLTAGMQYGVVPMYATWMPSMNYAEIIVSIPYVRMTNVAGGYIGPFAFPSHIFVTSVQALMMGRLAGYPKVMAQASVDATSFGVRSWRDHTPLVAGSYRACGPARPPKEFPPFKAVLPLLHQPICGSFLGGFLRNLFSGIFLDSYFQWDLDDCEMQPVEAEWQVTTDSIPALPRGTYTFKGYDQDWLGMGHMRAPWKDRGMLPRSALEIAEKRAERRHHPPSPTESLRPQ